MATATVAALREIMDHLGAAQMQRLSTDDPRIADHIDAARDHARAALAALREA